MWPENQLGSSTQLGHVTWKSIRVIYSIRATPAPTFVLIKWRGRKILSGQHSGLRRVVWPWPLNRALKINRDHLLIKGNPCNNFGIDQVKGSKVIDRTTKREWIRAINRNGWEPNTKLSCMLRPFWHRWHSQDREDENYRPTVNVFPYKHATDVVTVRFSRVFRRALTKVKLIWFITCVCNWDQYIK